MLYSINPYEQKNDGTPKHKVQLITLVHILVYEAIKLKDGTEEKNHWTVVFHTPCISLF